MPRRASNRENTGPRTQPWRGSRRRLRSCGPARAPGRRSCVAESRRRSSTGDVSTRGRRKRSRWSSRRRTGCWGCRDTPLCRARHNGVNAEKLIMPSEVQRTVTTREFFVFDSALYRPVTLGIVVLSLKKENDNACNIQDSIPNASLVTATHRRAGHMLSLAAESPRTCSRGAASSKHK